MRAIKFVFLSLFLSVGLNMSAQESSVIEPVVGKDPFIKSVNELTEFISDVNAKAVRYTSFTVASKGIVENITEEYRSSLESYKVELRKQYGFCKPLSDLHLAVTDEIALVEELIDQLPVSPKND